MVSDCVKSANPNDSGIVTLTFTVEELPHLSFTETTTSVFSFISSPAEGVCVISKSFGAVQLSCEATRTSSSKSGIVNLQS